MYHRYVAHCFAHASYFVLGLFCRVELYTSLLSVKSILEHITEKGSCLINHMNANNCMIN